MPTMKSVRTAVPGTIKVAETQRPAPGLRDALVRVRACGICGTDAAFVQMGGMPLGPEGETRDAAGRPAPSSRPALRAAKWGARLVTVAVHEKPWSPSIWARCCAAR